MDVETTSCRYYSLHGHVETMAREVQRGVNAVEGVEGTLWQVINLFYFDHNCQHSQNSCKVVAFLYSKLSFG